MNDIPQDELIRRLQQLGAIKPTPEATQQALARVRRALSAAPPTRLPFLRRLPIRRFVPAAAAVLFVAVGLSAWLFLSSPAPAQAGFVEVQAAMKAPVTLSCRQTKQVPGEPKETSRLLMRNGRWRIENGDDSYSVTDPDPAKRRKLDVNPQEHRAKLVQGKSFSQDNLYDAVKDLPRNVPARPLESKTIDGTNVLGFAVTAKAKEVTVWANASSLLPVRIEESTDDGTTVECSLDDFEFDQGLDPKLFVLEPPAGYKIEIIGAPEPALMADVANLETLVVTPLKGIGPVEFGMSRETVEKLLGLADSVQSVDNDRVEALSYHSHGFGIAVSKTKGVVSITCFAQPTAEATEIRPFGGQTDGGIAMGASAAAIMRAYDRPDDRNTVNGLTHLRYNMLQAEFTLSDSDKLVQIWLIRP